MRVLQSGDIYYYGFALDGLYLSGDSKRRIVSDALRADQNLAELADGENCMKFKNLDAENSANSTSIKNFAKSANSTSSVNSTNAANSINSVHSAEVAVSVKAKDASQSFELQNGDVLRARYKELPRKRTMESKPQRQARRYAQRTSARDRFYRERGATNRSAFRRRARADAARRSHRRRLRQRSKLHRIFATA